MTRLDRRRFLAWGSTATAAAAVGSLSWWAAALASDHFPVAHSNTEWQRLLGSARYDILRDGGTERPFSSTLLHEKRAGEFVCAGCGAALFSSQTKFDSGTGWPSFWEPLPHAVLTRRDHSFGMRRTEVLCSHCGGHLGHVFRDGPPPTGLRYCMNGLALAFRPAAAQQHSMRG